MVDGSGLLSDNFDTRVDIRHLCSRTNSSSKLFISRFLLSLSPGFISYYSMCGTDLFLNAIFVVNGSSEFIPPLMSPVKVFLGWFPMPFPHVIAQALALFC